ncbi:DNA-binding protein WhiA [Candidatus Soleaferrea massiliensis]|uniref:DNA-binding protein WhiA n=1 Tax=Candidatus Soleaferrea massiliensis TaxID=1470354 RepID=UPI00059035F9|nr:DNA-binding protein WhiA [Candidatus Soleaferrea massiliensis]
MSFGYQLKRELSSIKLCLPELILGQAYGILLFGKSFSAQSISIQTENEHVADAYAQLLEASTGVKARMDVSARDAQRAYTVFVEDAADRQRVLARFGHETKEVTLRIGRANLEDEESMKAFLRGAFLACGNVTDPQKGYHIEYVLPHYKLSRDLQYLIGELLDKPKDTVRRGQYVLYYKESEHIEDLLTMLGAVNASLQLMEVKVVKDMRNRINRTTNCETANISKTVNAAQQHIRDIRLIMKHGGLEQLDEPLRELAELRLREPDLSLKELGESLSEPISRSGVNHRLHKLGRIAEEYRERGGDGEHA